jgi:hypothetical protein
VDPLISSADLSTKPVFHAARASADGSHLAFLSAARLTPYDNTDVASPLPCGVAEGSREGVCDAEAYVYEADQEALRCVSCNPSGARPQGRLAAGLAVAELAQRAAASIPAAEDQLHAPRVLSGDGRRLFFDSFDALLPRDTNGAEDVYEWESAAGEEACAEKGADLYVEAAGGCLSLISSGESPQDSQFAEASPSGDDVFFTTTTSLLPQDPGLIDVYDARVEGGFAQPSATAACEGEACQGPAAPPNDPTPASAGFRGAGNVKKAAKARCAKGKARRRGRCVAKHKRARHKHQRKANRNRRNAR